MNSAGSGASLAYHGRGVTPSALQQQFSAVLPSLMGQASSAPRFGLCAKCNRPLIEIDHYGERLDPLTDETYADLLKKHEQPVGLMAWLKESVVRKRPERGWT